jgi:hypothetical protein
MKGNDFAVTRTLALDILVESSPKLPMGVGVLGLGGQG